MRFRIFGIVSSALFFIRDNIKGLLIVNLIPVALFMLLNIYWGLLILDSYYLAIEVMKRGVPLDLIEIPVNYETGLWIGSTLLLTFIALRTTRFRLLERKGNLIPSQQDLNSWFFTHAYAVLLLGVVYVGTTIPFYVIFYDYSHDASLGLPIETFTIPLLNIHLSFGISAMPLIALIQIIAALIISVLILNLLVRIMVSLPAVTIGLKPNIFKHMLQFSGRKSWSILIMTVLIIMAWGVFTVTILSYSLSKFEEIFEKSNSTVIKLFLEANWKSFMMFHALEGLLTVLLTIIMAVFFAEAYNRISQSKPVMGAQAESK